MTTDIVIVTHLKDAPWLHWSLKVLLKNLTGYRDIHIIVQDDRIDEVKTIVQAPASVHWHEGMPWKDRGYWAQQLCKLEADMITDAELILFTDSDVFVANPTDVQDYFVDGKPAWMWSWYTDIDGQTPWQEPTEKALGVKVEREYMRAQPFLIHRSTVRMARESLNRVHGNYSTYINDLSLAGESFSEYNVMGHVAFTHQQDLYTFIDRNREPWPKGIHNTRHYWSHAPLSEHMPAINAFLNGTQPVGVRWTNMGICVLEHDTHISKWVEQVGALDFDRGFMGTVCKYIKPGDVVVDVGAYIGDHTHAYAKATRGVDGGKVYAFEPNALPFYALTANMQGHGHVECINKGLGAGFGTMSIAQDPNVGASHLITADGDLPTVDIVPLDSLQLQRCNLIKIDAEGFELSILIGAQDTIKRCKPVLVLEMNAGALSRFGVTYDDIANWLLKNGYTMADIIGPEIQHDIICVPR